MDYEETVRYLYSLGNEVLTAKLGLCNISTLLNFLGSPHKKFQSILIAGTNGKGSVAAFVSSILRQAGFVTGLYTSPHLERIEERIQINGTTISPDNFARIAGEVRVAIDDLISQTRNELGSPGLHQHPTYFEVVTAIAFRHFAAQTVEIAVLEVGLGGRLDATNVVDPVVAVITNVELDHQQYLGESLEEIAIEKAGIIKPRTYAGDQPLPVIFCTSKPEVVQLLKEKSFSAGARLYTVVDNYTYKTETDLFGRYNLTLDCEFGKGIKIHVPLAGEHQVFNALTAIRVAEVLRSAQFEITREDLQTGIEQTRWPGRLEIIDTSPSLILDGAHNPAGAACVKSYVQKFLGAKKIILLFASMRDKDFVEMARTLFPLAKEIVLPKLTTERALEPWEITKALPEFKALYRCAGSTETALQWARHTAAPDDAILVVGSLFLIGETRRCLKSSESFAS